jgi:pimeloyl-ACP methyl ester carboxylesterase
MMTGHRSASHRTPADNGTAPGPRPGANGWRESFDRLAPTVLILGGFLTAPPVYERFVARLRARGAAGVVVANVWTPDWLLATARGPAAIATRSGRALLEAGRLAAEVSEGAPVLVVGHSAGGLIARILTATEPVCGRRFGAVGRIGAIVTLGTPHRLSAGQGIGRQLENRIAGVADTAAPGTLHSPRIGYVSVASSLVDGDPAGTGRERAAYLLYRSIVGRSAIGGVAGDGLVPVSSAVLPGSREVVLDGALHGPGAGGPWYGSDESLDVWWPVAVEAWRGALAIRAGR